MHWVFPFFLCLLDIIRQYCNWENFTASCNRGQKLMMTKAKYGRMYMGRCITRHSDEIGCYTDIMRCFIYFIFDSVIFNRPYFIYNFTPWFLMYACWLLIECALPIGLHISCTQLWKLHGTCIENSNTCTCIGKLKQTHWWNAHTSKSASVLS